jgi:cob(I)alamin adenosyltransferase
MSISTKRGDGGQTGLAGGIRVSKADLRVESYGSVDELNTFLGFARSICNDEGPKRYSARSFVSARHWRLRLKARSNRQ